MSCLDCDHFAWPDWCAKERKAIPGNTADKPEWCPLDANGTDTTGQDGKQTSMLTRKAREVLAMAVFGFMIGALLVDDIRRNGWRP